MLKALYNYKATYPAAVTFNVGDTFFQVPETKPDKNWYFVAAANGKSGFVPKNYMEPFTASDSEKRRFVSRILSNIDKNCDLNSTDRKETLLNIEKIKATLSYGSMEELDSVDSIPDVVLRRNVGSRESLNSVRSSKKRQAPKPPISRQASEKESAVPTSQQQLQQNNNSTIPHQVATSNIPSSSQPQSTMATSSHSSSNSNGCSKPVKTMLSTFSSSPNKPQDTSSDCDSSRCSISPRPLSSLGSSTDGRESSLPLDSDSSQAGKAVSSGGSTEDRFSMSSLKLPEISEANNFSHQTSISSVSTDSAVTDLATCRNSETDLVTVTYQHPQESCRQQALEMVENIRQESSLSHAVSTELLRSVLVSLVDAHKDLNVLVPSLINTLKEDLYSSESEIMASSDYTSLVDLFDQLTQAKEDSQQRNWMLYEDEAKILNALGRLHTILRNAKADISKSAISRWKYHYVQNLVEYFQMETRWSIRRVLIEVFTTLASIDVAVISLMLSSVLPLELIQDMYENNNDVERLRHCAVLLTIIFSKGETVPVHYVDHLGTKFVEFLLSNLENPIESDTDEILPDVFMGLIASYNLQFNEVSTNLVLEALAKAQTAKVFTEKLLLLLNREDDPAQLLGESDGPNSIHKLMLDVFSNENCINHFYTNDLMVLIDIIARQLCDLGPGEHRFTYLEMAHLVLIRSGYEEHQHRLSDLQLCLSRIQEEEGNGLDKQKAAEICSSFSCFYTSSC